MAAAWVAKTGLAVLALSAAAGGWAASRPGTAAEARSEALGALVDARIRAGGSFFTPAEQAVIVRLCGYRPGEWDGFEVGMENSVFRCTNGRRVDDPEMRAVMEAARPRIARRVEAVMASEEVRAAISRVAEAATREALAALDSKGRGHR